MTRILKRGSLVLTALANILATGCHKNAAGAQNASPVSTSAHASLTAINHIIVIYLENRSFDNLYGEFPGADGITGLAPERYRQFDETGKPFERLPQTADARIPPDLPNAPFNIERYIPSDAPTRAEWTQTAPQSPTLQERTHGPSSSRIPPLKATSC